MIRKYLEEVRERAIELRRKGMTYREIRERLKEEFKVDTIHEITLRRWFYRAGLIKFCRPLEERLEMARIVKKLYYEEGLGCRRIQKRLIELGYGKVSYDWINRTLRGIHTPDGNVKKIITKGYPFGFVVGALLSDGNTYRRGSQYVCKLIVKDVEFINKFLDCAKKIGLHANHYHSRKDKLWEVTLFSKMLYDLLTTGKWMVIIEGDEEAQKGFLDGYFEGDGNALILGFTSINRHILEFIRGLLEKRGIKTTLPIKSGMTTNNRTKNNHDIYTIFIHPYYYSKFTETITTCIKRKKYLIELSKNIIGHYLDKILNRKDWWIICMMLQRAVGKNMTKRRRRQKQTPANPPPFNSFYLLNTLAKRFLI